MTVETRDLYERYAELTRALDRMPRRKRGSAWETNRIRERDELRRRLEVLEGVDEVPSYGATLAAYPRP